MKFNIRSAVYLISSFYLCFHSFDSFGDDNKTDKLGLSQINPVNICKADETLIENLVKDFNIVQYDQKNPSHTSVKHVGKTYEDLLQILKSNPNIKIVSTYYDQEIVEHIIKEGLSKDTVRIVNWINSPDTKLTLRLDYQLSKPIGFGIKRGEDKKLETSIASIVLKKESDCTFIIKTSYPVIVKSHIKQSKKRY